MNQLMMLLIIMMLMERMMIVTRCLVDDCILRTGEHSISLQLGCCAHVLMIVMLGKWRWKNHFFPFK